MNSTDNITYTENQASEAELSAFFYQNADLFSPVFNGGNLGITNYAKKIKTYGLTIECRAKKNNQLVGLLVYYRNVQGNYIFVPYVCIGRAWQRKGIAFKLFCKLSSINISNNFEYRLEVRPENKKAVSLYKRLGFDFSMNNGEKWVMVAQSITYS